MLDFLFPKRMHILRQIERHTYENEKLSRRIMSKIDVQLADLTSVVDAVLGLLDEAGEKAAAAEQRAADAEAQRDAVISGDAAEDAAQISAAVDAVDTSASDAIKAISDKLRGALPEAPVDPEEPTDPPVDPPVDPPAEPEPEVPASEDPAGPTAPEEGVSGSGSGTPAG